MKTLYFECMSGISGDMTVSALLDLGVDRDMLLHQLSLLKLGGYHIETGHRIKNGIQAAAFDVILDDTHECALMDCAAQEHTHAEDCDHENTHEAAHDHGHDHGHEHGHEHEHEREHEHAHGHNHSARGLVEIDTIIDQSVLGDRVKETAKRIFRVLAEAEGEVHGKPPEEVHFHEVGAVDSIVDIVSTAICIDQLAPDRIVFSTLREGFGFVRCQHGLMPVPAPATLKLLQKCGAAVEFIQVRGEMVTPTGAAIVASLADQTGAVCPSGRIVAVGYGSGKKDFEHPNVLRAILIDTENACESDEEHICVLTASVDDMTGAQLGYAMEKLFEAGCADVYYTPIYMKKNRPAIELTVLCSPRLEDEIIYILFTHTSTIGMRRMLSERRVMQREMLRINTKYGEVGVKKCRYKDIYKVSVEYEDARRAADAHQVPLNAVYQDALSGL